MISEMSKTRWSCAAIFLLPGLCYSLLTSRMPALKSLTGVDDFQIGIALLSVGLVSFIGLSCSSFVVKKLGDKLLLAASSVCLCGGTLLVGAASDFYMLVAGFSLSGLGIGFLDSLMNVQGMFFERKYKVRSMNLFHAFYSLGAIVGSVSASLCAAYEIGPLLNYLFIALPWTGLCLTCLPFLIEGERKKVPAQAQSETKIKLPFVVFLLGLLALLSYVAEGTVAEWGSLFMESSKNADAALAALVYGMFSATIFAVRLIGDRLRQWIGDFRLIPICFVIAFLGMSVVLSAPNPYLALFGYLVMGVGLSPIVPTLFSLGGKVIGAPAAKTSSLIALFAYSGLLVFPPSIGWIAQHSTLGKALLLVLAVCVVSFLISLVLAKRKSQFTLN